MRFVQIFFIFGLSILTSSRAQPLQIHQITTPKGINAWFVEERNLPIISMSFAFEGGSANVPIGKEGLASFATELLLEGAGELPAHEFKEKLEELGIELSISANTDYVRGSLRTILENKDEAFKLLRASLHNPRLDDKSIDLVRSRLITNVRNQQKDPTYLVAQKMKQEFFKDHPYGRPQNGTLRSIKEIKKEDIKAFLQREFRRDGLKVVICGNLDIKDVPTVLDNIFGDLPAQTQVEKLQKVTIQFPGTVFIQQEPFPQSVCLFLQQGLSPKDPNYTKLALLNEILGANPTSRLWLEVREKRGLSYYVNTIIDYHRYSQFFGGLTGSENARIKEAVAIIRSEWQRAAQGTVTTQELNHAKESLVESIALALADTLSTTNALLNYFLLDFTPQYIYDREKRIRSVSLEELNSFARCFMTPKQLTFFIVGEPQGLDDRSK
jgi:zinc protease